MMLNLSRMVGAAALAWSLVSGCAFAQTANPGAQGNEDVTTAGAEREVLVELFTSQGCGLCPEANEYLGELDEENDGLLVLAFAVSYWDMYGWTDTYARPEYVQRQRRYLPQLGQSRLYTPHFVVDGAIDAPGWNQRNVDSIIEQRRAAMPDQVDVEIADGPLGSRRIRISGETPDAPLDVWLASYAPGWASVEIDAGENAGIDMLHYNMVKSLTYLGQWTGADEEFIGEAFRRYGAVVIVQGADGGPIYGLAHQPAAVPGPTRPVRR